MNPAGELNSSVAPKRGSRTVGNRSGTGNGTAFGFRAGLCYLNCLSS